MAIEIRPEQVSPLCLSLSISLRVGKLCLKKNQFFIRARCEAEAVSPPVIIHHPLLLSLFSSHQDQGIQFLRLSWDLNFTTLGGRPRPALNINLQNENHFNNPLTFDDVPNWKLLILLFHVGVQFMTNYLFKSQNFFCYLWSVVKNPVWMRISTKQWNQCSAHRDSFVACQLLSLFKWQLVRKNSNVLLFCLYFLFCSMIGLNDCNKEVNSDLNWTLVVLWCEE